MVALPDADTFQKAFPLSFHFYRRQAQLQSQSDLRYAVPYPHQTQSIRHSTVFPDEEVSLLPQMALLQAY